MFKSNLIRQFTKKKVLINEHGFCFCADTVQIIQSEQYFTSSYSIIQIMSNYELQLIFETQQKYISFQRK